MSSCRVLDAAFAVALLSAPILAHAADSTGHTGNYMTKDRLLLGSQLAGKPVYNDKQQEIGTIVDVLIDPAGGTPNVLLQVGKFLGVGDETVLVPVDKVNLGSGKMIVPGATPDSLAAMTRYHLDPLYTN